MVGTARVTDFLPRVARNAPRFRPREQDCWRVVGPSAKLHHQIYTVVPQGLRCFCLCFRLSPAFRAVASTLLPFVVTLYGLLSDTLGTCPTRRKHSPHTATDKQ